MEVDKENVPNVTPSTSTPQKTRIAKAGLGGVEPAKSARDEVVELRDALQKKDAEIEKLKQYYEKKLQDQESEFLRTLLASTPQRVRRVGQLAEQNRTLKAQLEEARGKQVQAPAQPVPVPVRRPVPVPAALAQAQDQPASRPYNYMIPRYDDDNFPPGEC